MSGADRAQRYRDRHLSSKGGKVRLQLFVTRQAGAQLKRLARHHGLTLGAALERLTADAERAVLDQIADDRARRSYLDGVTL
jgi:hypothetical protein